MPVNPKSLANLRPRPAFTSETARQAAKKSAEVRRQRKQEREQALAQAEQAALEDLARLAYKRLYQLLQDDTAPEKWLGAAREALDRAEGKPTQRIEQDQTVRQAPRTLEELEQELRQELAKLEQAGGAES